MTGKALTVLASGPLATVQDLGRPGHAALGVGWSGACDRGALRLANRLVANPEDAATVEVTLGGLALRAHGALTVALTGAPAVLTVDGRGYGPGAAVAVPDGAELVVGTPAAGVRSYLAVHGGVAVDPVLGSRSTDVLSGLGPDPLAEGAVLPVGTAYADWPPVDLAAVPGPPAGPMTLRVALGPRADWLADAAVATFLASWYEVTPDSNRVGLRLHGPPLERAPARRDRELPSEGLVAGAVQVPPSGRPVVFLADHPVTGGYPVAAVVVTADLDRAGQLRPGQRVRFRRT